MSPPGKEEDKGHGKEARTSIIRAQTQEQRLHGAFGHSPFGPDHWHWFPYHGLSEHERAVKGTCPSQNELMGTDFGAESLSGYPLWKASLR